CELIVSVELNQALKGRPVRGLVTSWKSFAVGLTRSEARRARARLGWKKPPASAFRPIPYDYLLRCFIRAPRRSRWDSGATGATKTVCKPSRGDWGLGIRRRQSRPRLRSITAPEGQRFGQGESDSDCGSAAGWPCKSRQIGRASWR